VKTIAFFNNKGGVGKTSLVYHLAAMYADLGLSVLAADFDPQANLSSMFLPEQRLEELWPDGEHPSTIYGAMRPLLAGTGDIAEPHVEPVEQKIGLVVGDLALAGSESDLNSEWFTALDGKERAFRVLSVFWRVLESAAQARAADVVLIDVGPNLGAINRAALIASEHVIIPLAPDLYSIQGLRNLGPTLKKWRGEWTERLKKNPARGLSLPNGTMGPAGYVVLQHSVRANRPVKAYEKWIARIPAAYREEVLELHDGLAPQSTQSDPDCLAILKHYRSLMPLAQEAHKPMFRLRPSDGAIGGHAQAAQSCRNDFKRLADKIAERTALTIGPR
jgi:cellulose biosynthesis protein BcsQ